MKHTFEKFARWTPWHKLQACAVLGKGSFKLIVTASAILFFAHAAHAQTDVKLDLIGGRGGGNFDARCPQGQLLTVFELRTGDNVDAIKPLCVTAFGPSDVGPLVPGGIWFGGTGGGQRQLVCLNTPIMTGMYVLAEGKDNVVVTHIHLFCGVAGPTQSTNDVPNAMFDAPEYHTSGNFGQELSATQHCPAGLVAVGIDGR
jgi:hypothetical protein